VYTLDGGFLVNLAAHAGNDILARIHLAAESVVLSEVLVVGSCIAMDEQNAGAIFREHIAQRRNDRSVGHGGPQWSAVIAHFRRLREVAADQCELQYVRRRA
jgi:hypothetical protein